MPGLLRKSASSITGGELPVAAGGIMQERDFRKTCGSGGVDLENIIPERKNVEKCQCRSCVFFSMACLLSISRHLTRLAHA